MEFVTPGRMVGEEVGNTNIAVHLREFGRHGVMSTVGSRLLEVNREANKLVAVLRNEFDLQEEERVIDQVVAEHGTLPRDELYFALKPLSRNLGQVDIQSLLQGRRQDLNDNIEGHFQLFRVGDAVASRNIHAAIYQLSSPLQRLVDERLESLSRYLVTGPFCGYCQEFDHLPHARREWGYQPQRLHHPGP